MWTFKAKAKKDCTLNTTCSAPRCLKILLYCSVSVIMQKGHLVFLKRSHIFISNLTFPLWNYMPINYVFLAVPSL